LLDVGSLLPNGITLILCGRAAKALGLTFPLSLPSIADEVIE